MLRCNLMKSLCFMCSVGFLCNTACAMVRVNGVDVDLNIVDAMMNPGEPQTRAFSRHGKMFTETVNRLGRTVVPCEDNTDRGHVADYYESYCSAFGGNRIVMRYGVGGVFLNANGRNLHYRTECIGALLDAALKYSVKPEEIVPSETDHWEIALLNITDYPESILIPMCLEGHITAPITDTIIAVRCKRFGIDHERIQSLAKVNASSMPNGDVVILNKEGHHHVDDAVFNISAEQYYWAHQLLEANRNVFDNLNDKE